MRAPDESLVGAILGGQYRIVGLIAAGGMGSVYDAEHVRLGHKVAIKVLHPLLSEDDETLVRFEREARAAASLGHPNVVLIHEFHRAPGELAWIAMERIPGRSLRELLAAEGALAPDRAVRLVLPLLSALEAAHAVGIIHRDLKPGNVMVTNVPGLGEAPKLVDFGIAKMTEGTGYTRLTRTGMVLGTPTYMAPELAAGGAADARSDVYAMGAILYALLSGRPPFRSSSLGELVAEVATRMPPPLAEAGLTVTPALEAVVTRAMAKDAGARFASAREMAEAISAATHVPVVSTPPTAHGAAMMPTRAAPVSAPAALERTRAGSRATVAAQPASQRAPFMLGAVAGVAIAVVGVVVAAVAGLAVWLTMSSEPVSTHEAPVARDSAAQLAPGPAALAPIPQPPPAAPTPPRARWGKMREHIRLAGEQLDRFQLGRGRGLAQVSGDCIDRSGTPRAAFSCGWTMQFARESGRAIVKWEEGGPGVEGDTVTLHNPILAPDAIPDSDALLADLDAHWTCPFRWESVDITINANGTFDTIDIDARAVRGSGQYANYQIDRYRNGRIRRSFRCYQ